MRATEKLVNLADLNDGEFVRGKCESRAAFLASIFDQGLYDGNDKRKCTRYASDLKRGDNLPPIVVEKSAGGLLVVDGWHRCVAAVLCGHTKIRALVVEGASDDESRIISEAMFVLGDWRAQLEFISILAGWLRAQSLPDSAGSAKPTVYISPDLGHT